MRELHQNRHAWIKDKHYCCLSYPIDILMVIGYFKTKQWNRKPIHSYIRWSPFHAHQMKLINRFFFLKLIFWWNFCKLSHYLHSLKMSPAPSTNNNNRSPQGLQKPKNSLGVCVHLHGLIFLFSHIESFIQSVCMWKLSHSSQTFFFKK